MNFLKHFLEIEKEIEKNNFTSQEVSLYFAILMQWNREFHKTRIKIFRDSLMSMSGIGSTTCYTKSMRILQDAGLVNYYPKSRGILSQLEVVVLGQEKSIQPTPEPKEEAVYNADGFWD